MLLVFTRCKVISFYPDLQGFGAIKKGYRKNEEIGLVVLLQCSLLIKENDPNNRYGRNNASHG